MKGGRGSGIGLMGYADEKLVVRPRKDFDKINI